MQQLERLLKKRMLDTTLESEEVSTFLSCLSTECQSG
jgi:hypothetical protein